MREIGAYARPRLGGATARTANVARNGPRPLRAPGRWRGLAGRRLLVDIDHAVGVSDGAYHDAAEFRQSPAELRAVTGRLLWPFRGLGWARGRLPRRRSVRAPVWPRLHGWSWRPRVIPGTHLPAWADRAHRHVPLALVPAPQRAGLRGIAQTHAPASGIASSR